MEMAVVVWHYSDNGQKAHLQTQGFSEKFIQALMSKVAAYIVSHI